MDQPPFTVLIVDDEPMLLRMMSAYLRRLSYTVMTFAGTDAAWEHVAERIDEVDVAVLDMSLAGMTTVELGVRLLTGNQRLRVIVASGYPSSLDELEAAGPGRVAFLHKPFTPDALAAVVRDCTDPDAA